MRRLLILSIVLTAFPAFAQPERSPTVVLTVSPAKIKSGDSATLTWTTTGARKAVLASATEAGETSVAAVGLQGTQAVKPSVSTLYRLYASRGFRRTYAEAGVEVESVTPPPPPPPPPVGDSGLSAIGIGSKFAASQSLAKASSDHDLRAFVEAQKGTWVVIDPLMLQAAHPPAMDAWVKVLTDSGKKQPAVIWYSKAAGQIKILGIDECSDKTTGADLLAMAKGHLPPVTDSVVINGKRHSLGLKPAVKGAPIKGPRVSQILTPLAEADFPKEVDLRGQFVYVKDQDGYGTCVLQAFSGAYEAACFRSFGMANSVEFSPNFLAVHTNGWNGTWAADAAKVIQSIGVVAMADQPNYSHQLPADWKNKAAQNKALGVYGPPESNPRGYVAAAIARGLPVCVGISVGNGFAPDSAGYITYAQGAGGGVNHEVLIVGGWFEHSGKKFVLMRNSWGRNWSRWNDGCAYIEDKFLNADTDMWVIVVPSAAQTYQFDSPPVAAAPKAVRPKKMLLSDALQKALDAAVGQPEDDAPTPPAASSPCANGKCGSQPQYQSRGFFRRR